MRTIETEIGTYAEWKLEDRQDVLANILQKHRYINVEYSDWDDFVLEDFCNESERLGFDINVEDVNYSGFHSQGDGASFTGSIDVIRFLKSTKKLTKYRSIVAKINDDVIADNVSIDRGSSMYCHEKTCLVDDIEVYDEELVSEKIFDLISELYEELEDTRMALCHKLYSTLNDSYEELISDESIIETFAANEYDFTEDGLIA